MKIALIVDTLGGGGAERQVVMAAAELQRLGEEVCLLVYHPENVFQEMISSQRIPLIQIAERGPLRLGRIRALRRHLKAGGFDIAHAFKDSASFYGGLAAAGVGIPHVFGGYRCLDPPPRLQKLAYRSLAGTFSGWIVNSMRVKLVVEQVLGVEPHRIHVLPNGIYFEHYQSNLSPAEARAKFGIEERGPVICMVAQLRPEKNHERFLHAARRVLDRGEHPIFLLAGDGPQRTVIEDLAGDLHLTDHLRLLGRREDIADVLRATDVVALTSQHEGQPNALIEAAAAGVPCVATRSGGAEDVVVDGETGYLVSYGDDAGMAERMIALLDDADLRARMGRAAQARARGVYSAEVVGENLRRIYRGVACGSA